MAISGDDRYAPAGDSGSGKLWNLCRMPFRQAAGGPAPASSSSSSGIHHSAGRYGNEAPAAGDGGAPGAPAGISTVAKALLPARRRLRLDPSNKLYFPCECSKNSSLLCAFLVLFALKMARSSESCGLCQIC
jgi:hypothetical protein